ncbi:hypothetical protein ACFFX0_19435 [Citricoccus parietis]|uniref:Uncharacterized protein n=1 Tax=Citricoccus parietis TaxID=592307 RepID=A0ABV5G2U5_9MICC
MPASSRPTGMTWFGRPPRRSSPDLQMSGTWNRSRPWPACPVPP